MEVATIKTESWINCPIYVRRFGTEFETLSVIGNEIHSNWLKVTPQPHLWLLWRLRAIKHPYTNDQLERAVNTCVSAMREAIEAIISANKKK